MFVNLITLSFTFLALAAGETLRTESKGRDDAWYSWYGKRNNIICPKTFTFYEVAIEGNNYTESNIFSKYLLQLFPYFVVVSFHLFMNRY